LINFGIMPLLFENQADYDKIEEKDSIVIDNAREQLAVGKPVAAKIIKTDGTEVALPLKHNMSQEDIDIVLAGGRLNRA
jgi:aconitate hydratase